MVNLLLKTLSPQSATTYSLLLKSPNITAHSIGKKMSIVVNTVYRNLKELMRLGLVDKIEGYPTKYKPKPPSEAVTFYTSLIRQNFYEAFGLTGSLSDRLKIKFFQTRKDFLSLVIKDINHAKKYINIIISGHEVPAELVLAHKKAADRGVVIRRLAQHINMTSMAVAKNWHKIGVAIKSTPLINARTVSIDGEVAYFGSYSPEQYGESVGVRFEYAPLALIMDEMFEKKWTEAKEI